MATDQYLTYGSYSANGEQFPVFESSGIYPSAAPAPYFYGRGTNFTTLSFQADASAGALGGVGGDVELAVNNPFSLVHSPTLWAVAFLVIGLLGLRHVHWRG